MTTSEAIFKLNSAKGEDQDPFKKKMDTYLKTFLPECCLKDDPNSLNAKNLLNSGNNSIQID